MERPKVFHYVSFFFPLAEKLSSRGIFAFLSWKFPSEESLFLCNRIILLSEIKFKNHQYVNNQYYCPCRDDYLLGGHSLLGLDGHKGLAPGAERRAEKEENKRLKLGSR